MNLIDTLYHWPDWSDGISTRQEEMLHPQKCAFWEMSMKVKKHNVYKFRAYSPKFCEIETDWAKTVVKPWKLEMLMIFVCILDLLILL